MSRRLSALRLLAVACFVAAFPGLLAAQGVSKDRPNVTRGSLPVEQDENVRVSAGRNDRDAAPTVPPPEKAEDGSSARGNSSNCTVHFDNRSNTFIAVYVDGVYRGELAPWGDVRTFVIGGSTRLYARAGFTDGSVSTWGPRLIECPAGGNYTWMLYQ